MFGDLPPSTIPMVASVAIAILAGREVWRRVRKGWSRSVVRVTDEIRLGLSMVILLRPMHVAALLSGTRERF